MSLRHHAGPGLPVHPPLLYLAALLVGIGLNYLWPIAPMPERCGIAAGVVLILLGTVIMPPTLLRFYRAGTPFDPHKPASALITDGPYRYSRNPAYVALTLWYLGIALLLNNGWALLLVLGPLLVVDRCVIQREEQHLEAKFGEAYRRYKSTARRWL
ncbi:MAG: isoprenylcysteine carboxylmethyltransferase family protein [Phycisphaerales bacterium]